MTEIQRRTILAAGGAIAVGTAVAACGSSGSDAQTGTPTGGAASSPNGGAAGAIATVDEIPVGSGVIDSTNQVVVTQPTSGSIKAYTAVCPHQGCTVSSVENNEIICGCHNSRFSAEDGSVISGPAEQGLASASVQVQNGSITLG